MRSMGECGTRVTSRLVSLQGGRSDAEMADILGCARVYYLQLRTGRRRLSYAMAKRAARHFPEILAMLMRDLTEVA